jgi:23S rRNA pseudouridine1911/1915/1917 synthase
VPPVVEKTRLSDYAVGIFNSISTRKGIKKAILRGLVTINGKQGFTADFISGGELIELFKASELTNKPTIEIPLTVIYEDDYLAIVNKPPGILVSGNKKWTIENALPPHLKKSSQQDFLQRPEPIHRLDYPTSGALLIGKTVSSVVALNKLFENRQIEKTYLAVSIGEMDKEGIINLPIDKKTSRSFYTVLDTVYSPKYGYFNLVKLKPETGRRHQLRKHLAAIGNPILGDLLYCKEDLLLKGKGLYLHAASLKFIHPFTNEQLIINAPVPKKFGKLFPLFKLI